MHTDYKSFIKYVKDRIERYNMKDTIISSGKLELSFPIPICEELTSYNLCQCSDQFYSAPMILLLCDDGELIFYKSGKVVAEAILCCPRCNYNKKVIVESLKHVKKNGRDFKIKECKNGM